MEAVVEGLWGLAEYHENRGEIGKAVKCLEAICQSQVSFFPIVEVKTRLRIATLLLHHSHNVNHAKSHLERSQLLLKSIPSCFELKCRAYSLLSLCYHLVGAIPPQKQVLYKGLDLTASAGKEISTKLWSCNFNSQLAKVLLIEGDYRGSISVLECGYVCATEVRSPELQMFFATSMLHVHLMQWNDDNMAELEQTVNKCNEIWESIQPDNRRQCPGLLFYNELLHIFYWMRLCDYKNAAPHVDNLDAAVKADRKQAQHMQELVKELSALDQSLSRSDLHYREKVALSEKQAMIQEQLRKMNGFSSIGRESLEPVYFGNGRRTLGDKLQLAPPPIDGEWLPKSAVYALVDLIVVIFGRPKGLFKECGKRIQSGMLLIQDELVKLGITDCVREVDLQHSSIWMAGVYLMLLIHFLENKVAIELTRAEFVEAQEALVQMKNWFMRFPTILQPCECIIEMLRGQYAHSVGCYNEASFHYIEAVKLTESKSMQAMCQVYAAVSYTCIGDAESTSQALDLIGPVYEVMDSFVGVREKTGVLFVYGLLLMKQQDIQEARNRLARGVQLTHTYLGNLQLISQYLTTLGSLALAMHDTVQAREILKSSLTLAKKLYDIPTQVWVLSVLTALYQELGETGNEMQNVEFQTKRSEDLQKRLADAQASIYHIEIIDKVRFEVQRLHEFDIKRAMAGPTVEVNLDIPESIGLSAPSHAPSSSRLVDIDGSNKRRGKRRI
ncbi:sister chromatid cohesion protein SCC4 isoform X2 [Cicer arietinum]|uniref:Sister chromatid cohesion protein SCC4 isoform X2 n=1 Tax=Cicer arietinum TaxID=3827 RepID=A0A1S2XMW2_CICAR|nr:sister chromatid cohesion protein SCC4 isoform X2 [Cicer arietinum]